MILKVKKLISETLSSHANLAKDLFDEKNHLASARDKFLVALPFWIAGSAAAMFAILYARVFLIAEHFALNAVHFLGSWILISTPLLFLASWWLVDRFAPFANGSGIPQLMAAAHLTEEKTKSKLISLLLGPRIIIFKVVSSLLGVVGGGAIGREGPTLQISGSIFDTASRYLPARLRMQNRQGMILAGGAAGLAAAFNTPLGGIAYVIEELSKSHLSFFRTGILHAVIVSGLISQLIMGSYLYFGYPKVDSFVLSQLGMVLVVSLFAGVTGSLFGQFLKYVFNFRTSLNTKRAKAGTAIFCGFVFALMVLFVSPAAMGSGRDLIEKLLFDGQQASFIDVLCRFFGTAATYASGGAGGIFAPTLAIGGTVGNLAENFLFNSAGPLAVLAGMTASLAALTQSPLTSFILILEMTDRHSALLPIMIAAMIGQGISKLISRESFYEFVTHKLLQNIAPDSAGTDRKN